MRRVGFVVLILLMSSVSAIIPINIGPSGGEVVFEGEWNEAIAKGLVPLRHLTRDTILVWDYYSNGESDIAPWKAPLKNSDFNQLRLILEPNLPDTVVEKIYNNVGGSLELRPAPLSNIITITANEPNLFTHIPGILWVEPILETTGRNIIGSEIMQTGTNNSHPFWDWGLNGSGVVIGVADGGIDLDHSCFRNSSYNGGETPGLNHRKIVYLNDSIDDWDNVGDKDYRHGTHIAGTLACSVFGDNNSNNSMTSMSNSAKLIVQDLVNESGWNPPDIDLLLAEAAGYGAIIHSDSWGDNTVAYTARSSDLDAWAFENPYSLAFIAPGNNGGQVLEPANARNVVSVAVTDSNHNGSIWGSSNHGPTEEGGRGIFIAAPGKAIVSAMGDGVKDSYNNGSRTLTGTSMATPMAASYGAILQQLIERENGVGPSGSLLRAMMAISADGITGNSPDSDQGFGRPNLSLIVDEENGNLDIWTHDSYQQNDWLSWYSQRGGSVEGMVENPWNGDGAVGPFLKEGENASWEFIVAEGSDLEVVMSYNARPHPSPVDDLKLVVDIGDGRFVVGDDIASNGYSHVYNSSEILSNNHSTNETTHLIRVNGEFLENNTPIRISVFADWIGEGNSPGNIGIDGDMIGFALAVKGLDEDPWVWQDLDADGVLNIDDLCVDVDASDFDSNSDGCIDDSDGDGFLDDVDYCRFSETWHPINETGCAKNNTPLEIIVSGIELNTNKSDFLNITWSVVDNENDDIELEVFLINPSYYIPVIVCNSRFIGNYSGGCNINLTNDLSIYQYSRSDWKMEIVVNDFNSSNWTSPKQIIWQSNEFSLYIIPENLDSIPAIETGSNAKGGSVLIIIGAFGLIMGVLLATSVAFFLRKKDVDGGVKNPFIDNDG